MTTTTTTDTKALVRALRRRLPKYNVIDAGNMRDAADTIERLTRERDEAQQVCAEAYQVVGVLLGDTGQFETEHGTKILDNLSEHRPVHDDVLPWAPANTIECDAIEEAVARERERWESAFKQTWQMIDPLHPEGSPGSYARGQYNGIIAALQTLSENADRAIRTTKATT